MSARDEHLANVSLCKSSTDGGMVMRLSDEHPSKAPSPIYFTEEGISMSASDEHPANVFLCNSSTDEGMVILISDEQ